MNPYDLLQDGRDFSKDLEIIENLARGMRLLNAARITMTEDERSRFNKACVDIISNSNEMCNRNKPTLN